MSMSLETKPGDRVRFDAEGGTDHDRMEGNQRLQKGAVYTVTHLDVENWRSWVYLKECPGVGFNTVMFENVVEQPAFDPFPGWPRCAYSSNCENRSCLALNSTYCFDHTVVKVHIRTGRAWPLAVTVRALEALIDVNNEGKPS